MKGMTFKMALLLSGIFLLSTFMLVQMSWGCDDDKDKWDCDHHDKWDCHKHGKPCHPPKIQSVDVDLENNKIIIHGENFDDGGDPVVTLGGIKIDIFSHVGDEIVAIFEPSNFPDSDYRLVVSTCYDSLCNDKYCKDHGPKCKCKYCKDHCSKCKDKYCKDYEYKCRCKDRYSLTIPGPSGPPSPITLTTVPQLRTFPGTTEDMKKIDDIAVCEGGLVTGGGFSCPDCEPSYLHIKVNEPWQDLINGQLRRGWHVFATYSGTDSPQLTIYAICAQAL